MRRSRYWLFMLLSVPAIGIALLFTGLAWLVTLPARKWRERRARG